MIFDKSLAKFTIGTVVAFGVNKVGHVHGFTLNDVGEVILVIKVPRENFGFHQDNEPFFHYAVIHPANVELVSDFVRF